MSRADGKEGMAGAERLLVGAGRFSADLQLPGQAHAAFLRSPAGHGAIRALDLAPALSMPGVLVIVTGEDLVAAGLKPLRGIQVPPGMASSEMVNPERPSLAVGRVRHVGEPIALVVAESAAQAADAADAIHVEIEPLAAIADVEAALAPGGPAIWKEAPDNVSFVWRRGDPAAVERAFRQAARVVSIRVRQQRVAGTPLEPRAALAAYDSEAERYVLRCGSQGASALRNNLAPALGVPPERLRVVTGDVGGAFGLKTPPYPEYGALLFAARRLARPVKWVSSRSEAFLSDNQGRDSVAEARLALDADGRFLALDIAFAVAMGAYLSASGTVIATRNFSGGLSGLYRIPAIALASRGIFTNTLPTGPYRGAGRPEATFLLERLIDKAGRETGLGPAEIRRRNLIQPSDIPYTTPLGDFYDSGDFPAVFEAGLEAADLAGFEKRRREAAARGRLRGIGLSAFAEVAGNVLTDIVDFRVTTEGRVEVRVCTQSTGQSHQATFARLAAERLGVPASAIDIVEGDSDLTPSGGPSVASRTTMVTGPAIAAACEEAVARARSLAAERLEAAEADLLFADGAFRVAGTDRAVGFLELAQDAETAARLSFVEPFAVSNPTFPNGCHVAEVEVEPETGAVAVLSYTAVDDCGTVLDHAIVDGQLMGGVTQGLGQALMEACRYDADGQLLTGSLMDYALPRADHAPEFRLALQSTPSPGNRLGVKGAGEAGTTGSLSALINAVNDALASVGAGPVEMPATAEAVWQALKEAKAERRPVPAAAVRG